MPIQLSPFINPGRCLCYFPMQALHVINSMSERLHMFLFLQQTNLVWSAGMILRMVKRRNQLNHLSFLWFFKTCNYTSLNRNMTQTNCTLCSSWISLQKLLRLKLRGWPSKEPNDRAYFLSLILTASSAPLPKWPLKGIIVTSKQSVSLQQLAFSVCNMVKILFKICFGAREKL